MKKITVQIPKKLDAYDIIISQDLLDNITEHIDVSSYSSVMIISDSNVSSFYIPKIVDAIRNDISKDRIHTFIFESGEKNKSLDTVTKAYQQLINHSVDRKSLIINVGGGVVSDMGGFIASTYLRGIPFINIPTTLESMVDASVGGKTGVNFGQLKNYIGVFSQPKQIIIDIDTLKTLPPRALIQGYAEVIKHGLVDDEAYFKDVIRKKPAENSEKELIDIIGKSIEIKAQIVQQDVNEKGVRKLLNFGHTIGHVIESLAMHSSSPLFHGEAVAIGMVAESYISASSGMLADADFRKIETAIQNVGLPTRFHTSKAVEDIEKMLITDKKTEEGTVKWALLSSIGKGEFNISIDPKFVKEGIKYILEK